MTSKLKVNLINDAGDNNLITSDGSGSVTLGTAFPPVGKIGQVVQVSGNGGVSTTSTSFVAAPIAVTITPTATSSKVYVSIAFMNKTATDQDFYATIYRDTTNLGDSFDGFFSNHTKVANSKSLVYMQYVDSPSTTSATEYKVYFKGEGQTVTANNDNADWSFIAMEVLA
jgi:hypothetical protein